MILAHNGIDQLPNKLKLHVSYISEFVKEVGVKLVLLLLDSWRLKTWLYMYAPKSNLYLSREINCKKKYF